MPRIPTYQATESPTYPRISPAPIRELGESMRRSMGQLTDVLAGYEEAIRKEMEREQRAKDALEALKIENQFEEKTDAIAESYSQRIDYEKFDEDIKKDNERMRNEVRPKSMSRELNLAFEKTFGDYSRRLTDAIKNRKYTVMGQLGQVEALILKNTSLEEYANAPNDQEREIAKIKYESKMDELIKSNLLNPVWVQNQKGSFEKEAKQYSIDLADVEADKAIMADPLSASINLHDRDYIPNLPPKKRQDKIEKAEAVYKVWKGEQERKAKEIEKTQHDEEDKEIANLFMIGNYKDAFLKTLMSERLSGDEKRVWTNAINTATKEDAEKIDPDIEDSNYAFVNELIAKEANPKTIRRYIFSNEFKSTTRQKLLDRLDTETDKAINKASSRAYDYLKSQIMPYGGMLAEVPPLQASQYTKAMNALDDWINEMRKADKPITSKDIHAKAEQLALDFQTTIPERQEQRAKEDKEYFESLMKGKEKKPEIPPVPTIVPPSIVPTAPIVPVPPEIEISPELIPSHKPAGKYEIDRIYTDAQGRKAKYLGGGDWELLPIEKPVEKPPTKTAPPPPTERELKIKKLDEFIEKTKGETKELKKKLESLTEEEKKTKAEKERKEKETEKEWQSRKEKADKILAEDIRERNRLEKEIRAQEQKEGELIKQREKEREAKDKFEREAKEEMKRKEEESKKKEEERKRKEEEEREKAEALEAKIKYKSIFKIFREKELKEKKGIEEERGKIEKEKKRYEDIEFLVKQLAGIGTFKDVMKVLRSSETKEYMKRNDITEEDILPYIYRRFPGARPKVKVIEKSPLYREKLFGPLIENVESPTKETIGEKYKRLPVNERRKFIIDLIKKWKAEGLKKEDIEIELRWWGIDSKEFKDYIK